MRKAGSCPLGERAATFGERLDALPSAEICFARFSSDQDAPTRVNAKLVICLSRRNPIKVKVAKLGSRGLAETACFGGEGQT